MTETRGDGMKRKEKKAKCQRCGKWFRHRSTYAYRCAGCRILHKQEQAAQWKRDNAEKSKAYGKAWRGKHRNRNKELQARWLKRNPEKTREYNQRAYWKNVEKSRADAKRRRDDKKARIRERAKQARKRGLVQGKEAPHATIS